MTVSQQTRTQLLRVGAVVAFIGLPLLLVGLAVSNLMEAAQSDDLAARKATTTAAIVAQIEKHRASHAKPIDPTTLYLASASGSLARAEIQALTTKLVDTAGGRVAEVELVETPEQDADGTVAIAVTLDIDNKGLRDLLYAIESGLPLLTITDIDAQQASAQADDATAAPGGLKVQMTVQGHWRKATG